MSGGDEMVAQRSCGCPVIGSVQAEVGQDFEQPVEVKDIPVHGGWGGWGLE